MAAAIAFLSDFGLEDHYVGVVKGVIAGIAPGVQIIDISHSIAPYSIAEGAFLLLASYRYFPEKTVFLAVVDPGVGGERAGLAIRAGGRIFVAPDNGLLAPVLLREPGFEAVALDAERLGLSPHPTFHARDLFAPVAARLADGMDPDEAGPRTVPLLSPPWDFEASGEVLKGEVIHRDRFGTLVTSIPNSELELWAQTGKRLFLLEMDSRSFQIPLSTTFCDVQKGALTLLKGSSGFVEVAVNQGDASALLGASTGAGVLIKKHPGHVHW